MTDKPNCSTCNHIQTESTGIPDDICNKDPKNPVRMTDDRKWIIKKYGCIYHPQAREYLMREVIAELKKRSNADRTAYVPACVRKTTLEEAITLIRDGVVTDAG